MSLKRIMSNYADYNLWVNQQFVNWLSPKSDELLYAEVPSSFSTIMKTLDHIWSTEEYWFSVISETAMSEKKTENELSKEEIFEGLLNSSTKLKQMMSLFKSGVSWAQYMVSNGENGNQMILEKKSKVLLIPRLNY